MKPVLLFIVLGWIFRIAVMLVVVFIGFGAIAFLGNDAEPPKADKAQYAIQTYSTDGAMIPSRIYFTDEVVFNDNLPSVNDYWWFDGESYHHIKKERVFTEPVEIVRRVQ